MQNKSLKSFTLIELLVVIAIIGILASLLIPALGKSRDKARTAVCKSQQKNIGIATFLYVDDNQMHYPIPSLTIPADRSWDDDLSSYLGISLTIAQQNEKHLSTDENVKGLEIFRCPSDPFEAKLERYRRTYTMVRGRTQYREHWGGVAWVGGSWKTSDVQDGSGSAMFSEYPAPENYVGRGSNYSHTRYPDYQIQQYSDLHGHYKSTFLFTDGHVENLHIYSNLGDGTPDNPRGMWDILADD